MDGTVKDSGQVPIPSAVVTLSDLKGDSIVAFEIADDQGRFRLYNNSRRDSLLLTVSLLGFESQSHLIVNKSQQIEFHLISKDIQLKEVLVKPPNMWLREDTLTYNLGNFISKQDRYIGDILKKLPGIEVNESGGISYKGAPINKFYIEGMDLLENKYSIATNNIPVEVVSNVQVIENHQNIKSLKNVVFSDQAAINLKLKNSKMLKPIGNVEVGAGWEPFLWDLKFFSMQVNKNRQTMLTYKTVNTGKNIALELTEHILSMRDVLSDNPFPPSSAFVPVSFNSPPVSDSRHLFNKTHMVSLNNLWRINDDSQFRVNIDYLNDEQAENIQRRSEYFFPDEDSTLILNEVNSFNRYNNTANANLTYTFNSSRFFLENSLKLQGKWMTETNGVTGSDNVSQRFHIPLYFIQNNLEVVKKYSKRIFRFRSFTRYSNQPQQLQVTPDTIPGNEENKVIQNLNRSVFFTNNETSWGIDLNSYSSIMFDLKLKADIQYLDSEMDGNPLSGFETNNKFNWNLFDYRFTPSYVFKKKDIRINLNLPLTVIDLYTNDKIINQEEHSIFLFIDPALFVHYEINSYWEASLSYKYQHEIGDLYDLNQGIIQTNYRDFIQGSGILEKRTLQNYVLRLGYRNPIDAFFFNFTSMYIPLRSNQLASRRFIDIYSISIPEEMDNKRAIWNTNLSVGKYLEGIKTNVSLNAGYSSSRFEQQQQGVKVPVASHIVSIIPKIDIKIGEYINIMYEASILNTRMNYFDNDADLSNQIAQSLRFFIFPSKRWQIRLQSEYWYNDLSSDLSTHLFFEDIGIKYKLKTIEFGLDWTNIFNKENYSYTLFDGINTYYSNYKLRPTNVLLNVSFKY